MRQSWKCCAALGAVGALAWLSPASAATILAGRAFFDYGPVATATTTSSTTPDVSRSDSESAGGVAFTAMSQTDLGGGSVTFHAKSSLNGVVTTTATPPTMGLLDAVGISGVSDTITVTSPGLSGSGVLEFTLNYSGTTAGSVSAGSFSAGAFGVLCRTATGCPAGDPTEQRATLAVAFTGGPSSVTASGSAVVGSIPFTYGVPVPFSLQLVENAIDVPSLGQSVDISDNFFDTASLQGIEVVSSDGIVDPNAVIQSDTSDFVYATAVPEPGTWALMLLGIGAAGGFLRRRRFWAARLVIQPTTSALC